MSSLRVNTGFCPRNTLPMKPVRSYRVQRLTNAFSKKVHNNACAMALHFLYYNFVCIHRALKVMPAMAAGVTDRLWEVADMVAVLEAWGGLFLGLRELPVGSVSLDRFLDCGIWPHAPERMAFTWSHPLR